MAIPATKKDTMDYQMIGGLDEDGEAQELTFVDDAIKISMVENAVISRIESLSFVMKTISEQLLTELKIINTHLSILTENRIGEEDVY